MLAGAIVKIEVSNECERERVDVAEQWYVQMPDGAVEGPFVERDVAARLLDGSIADACLVKQGIHGQWCGASRARAVFQQLAETGWYIRAGEEQFGPFTEARLLQLHASGEMADGSELRKGTSGPWKSAESILSLWQQQKVPTPSAETPEVESIQSRQWSVEPIRHVIMAIELDASVDEDELLPSERLLLSMTPPFPESLEGSYRLSIMNTNGRQLGKLSEQNSRQVAQNAERGLTHLAMWYPRSGRNCSEIALVLCPPGISPELCRQYIEQHLRLPGGAGEPARP